MAINSSTTSHSTFSTPSLPLSMSISTPHLLCLLAWAALLHLQLIQWLRPTTTPSSWSMRKTSLTQQLKLFTLKTGSHPVAQLDAHPYPGLPAHQQARKVLPKKKLSTHWTGLETSPKFSGMSFSRTQDLWKEWMNRLILLKKTRNSLCLGNWYLAIAFKL